MANKTREPLVHISRRSTLPWYQSWGIRACALILSLGVCALVTVLTTGENPLSVFGAIYDASFSSQRRTWVLFQNIAMLLSVSLAVVPAFKMRFWNLGGEGQMLAGALATTACMICLRDAFPNGALIPVMIVCSIAAGALWGFVPAFFKAKWGTNETLFTLMMNYIAIQLVSFFIIVWEMPKGAGQIGIINQSTEIGWLPPVAGQKYLLNIIVVAVLTVFMFIYMKYSKHGYEISVVGESVRTARYVGIRVEKVIIRTMVLSGALCGLAGYLIAAGADQTVTTESAGGQGFTGILVAWLGKFNPLFMIITAGLIQLLNQGAAQISQDFDVSGALPNVIVGIILFFIIGSEFFINYQVHFRRHSARKESVK